MGAGIERSGPEFVDGMVEFQRHSSEVLTYCCDGSINCSLRVSRL